MRRENKLNGDLFWFLSWPDESFDGEEWCFEDEYFLGDVRELVGFIGNIAEILAILLEGDEWIDDAQTLVNDRLFGLFATRPGLRGILVFTALLRHFSSDFILVVDDPFSAFLGLHPLP